MANSKKIEKSIHIVIKLFATLSKYLPPDSDHYRVSAGMTAGDLTTHLNLPKDQLKLIFINGCKRPLNTVLNDQDRIGIFPPVGGG